MLGRTMCVLKLYLANARTLHDGTKRCKNNSFILVSTNVAWRKVSHNSRLFACFAFEADVSYVRADYTNFGVVKEC